MELGEPAAGRRAGPAWPQEAKTKRRARTAHARTHHTCARARPPAANTRALHTRTHTHIHARTHTHTCTHARTHTCTHKRLLTLLGPVLDPCRALLALLAHQLCKFAVRIRTSAMRTRIRAFGFRPSSRRVRVGHLAPHAASCQQRSGPRLEAGNLMPEGGRAAKNSDRPVRHVHKRA